jgi:hypothetical protein
LIVNILPILEIESESVIGERENCRVFVAPFHSMAVTDLVLDNEVIQVPRLELMRKCHTFENDPALLARPYRVVSRVPIDAFRLFANAILGMNPAITIENVNSLDLLCREFDFAELSATIRQFVAQHSLIDPTARDMFMRLEQLVREQAAHIATLEAEHATLKEQLTRGRPIRVLHVTPIFTSILDVQAICHIDPHGRIEVDVIDIKKFISIFGGRRELVKYNVLVLGGSDMASRRMPGIDLNLVAGTFRPYWENGGSIIFFHDIFHSAQPGALEAWGFFIEKFAFGPSLNPPMMGAGVEIVQPGAAVLKFPFTITNFQPTQTHSTNDVTWNAQRTVIGRRQDDTVIPYYTEGDRVALMEAGHSDGATLSPMEQRLLVNAIYRLAGRTT